MTGITVLVHCFKDVCGLNTEHPLKRFSLMFRVKFCQPWSMISRNVFIFTWSILFNIRRRFDMWRGFTWSYCKEIWKAIIWQHWQVFCSQRRTSTFWIQICTDSEFLFWNDDEWNLGGFLPTFWSTKFEMQDIPIHMHIIGRQQHPTLICYPYLCWFCNSLQPQTTSM